MVFFPIRTSCTKQMHIAAHCNSYTYMVVLFLYLVRWVIQPHGRLVWYATQGLSYLHSWNLQFLGRAKRTSFLVVSRGSTFSKTGPAMAWPAWLPATALRIYPSIVWLVDISVVKATDSLLERSDRAHSNIRLYFRFRMEVMRVWDRTV